MQKLGTGSIGIGNISTLATFNKMFVRAGGECCHVEMLPSPIPIPNWACSTLDSVVVGG